VFYRDIDKAAIRVGAFVRKEGGEA